MAAQRGERPATAYVRGADGEDRDRTQTVDERHIVTDGRVGSRGCTDVLRVALDSPSLAELLADKLTFFVPLPLFDAIIGLLGSAAKRLFFASVVLVQVGIDWLAERVVPTRHVFRVEAHEHSR